MAASRSMVLSLWLGGVVSCVVLWGVLYQHGISQAVTQSGGSWRERFLRPFPPIPTECPTERPAFSTQAGTEQIALL